MSRSDETAEDVVVDMDLTDTLRDSLGDAVGMVGLHQEVGSEVDRTG